MRIFPLIILSSLIFIVAGCTKGNESQFYQVQPTSAKNGNFFGLYAQGAGVEFNNVRLNNYLYIVELAANGELNLIPSYIYVNYGPILGSTVGNGKTELGTYEYVEGQDLFLWLTSTGRYSYKVHKANELLTLQGNDEEFQLLPIRVVSSAPMIYLIVIALWVCLPGLLLWSYYRYPQQLTIFLSNHPFLPQVFSSIVVGIIEWLKLARRFGSLQLPGELLALVILAAPLVIYLCAVAYHVISGWFGGKGRLSATASAFYQWFWVVAGVTLYFQLAHFVLSIEVFQGKDWAASQIINYIAGQPIDFPMSAIAFVVFVWGFYILAAKMAKERGVSTWKSSLALLLSLYFGSEISNSLFM